MRTCRKIDRHNVENRTASMQSLLSISPHQCWRLLTSTGPRPPDLGADLTPTTGFPTPTSFCRSLISSSSHVSRLYSFGFTLQHITVTCPTPSPCRRHGSFSVRRREPKNASEK